VTDFERKREKMSREEQMTDVVKEIFGEDAIKVCKATMDNERQKALSALNEGVKAYIKMIDDAFEATKGSTLQFD